MNSTYRQLLAQHQKDLTSQLDYLMSLKASRVEGMIIEHEAESAFFNSSLQKNGWRKFTSRVLFCGGRIDGSYRQWFSLVYDNSANVSDCRLVQQALAKAGYPVRLLDVRGPNPVYWHDVYGAKLTNPSTLLLSKTEPADETVLDEAKVKSVFWRSTTPIWSIALSPTPFSTTTMFPRDILQMVNRTYLFQTWTHC